MSIRWTRATAACVHPAICGWCVSASVQGQRADTPGVSSTGVNHHSLYKNPWRSGEYQSVVTSTRVTCIGPR
eukprot:4313458-Lingulodinium_polyedra.AAC.1